MNPFLATLLAFLPKRYRGNLTPYEIPVEGAVWGGTLEALFSLGLLIYRYFAFMNERMALVPETALEKAGHIGGESLIMALGPIFLLEYFLHLSTIVLTFFMLEGLVRLAASVISGEVLPSLPLYLTALLHTHLDAHHYEKSQGERIRDHVQLIPADGSLQISSCRPKSWNQLTTISHEGELYELVSAQHAPAPRPFVYVLRKKPPTAVIRGIHPYDPDEVLQPK
jgi:hypothetical protein